MGRPHIPRADRAAAAWMRHFAQRLQDAPAGYFVPIAEIDAVIETVAEFRTALAIALVPDTRTAPSVARKNRARAEAERVCRVALARIKIDPRVSAEDRAAVGISLDPPHRTRSKAPTTPPTLVVTSRNGVYTVKWTNDAMSRRAKPAGCAMLQLFLATGEGEAGEALLRCDGAVVAEQAKLINVYTSNRVQLFEPELSGEAPSPTGYGTRRGVVRTAALVARWAGPKGQPGPWSKPATLRLAA